MLDEKRNAKFISGIMSVMAGYQIAGRIVSENQKYHYLVMHKHIGDVMKMLKSVVIFKNYYSGKENFHLEELYGDALPKAWIVEKVIIITNELLAGVVRLCPCVDCVIVLSEKELHFIGEYSKSSICVHKNLHRDGYGFNGDLVGADAKKTIFGISSYEWLLNLPAEIPNKQKWISGFVEVDNSSMMAARRFLDQWGANPQKTVILCPYAKTTSMLPEENWDLIIDCLQQDGFWVFTNVGPKEKELRGTIRLQVPVNVYAALGELGCIIIGVQSGIIDVIRLMDSNIRMIDLGVLYKAIDTKCARNRKVRQAVDYKENVIHILISKNEADRFSELLLGQFAYFKKGNQQKEAFLQGIKENIAADIYQAGSLQDYMKILAEKKDIVIFVSACNVEREFWIELRNQNVGVNGCVPSENVSSYAAVVDAGRGFFVERSEINDKRVKYQGEFSDINQKEDQRQSNNFIGNRYYVISHAAGKESYKNSSIVINGQQYSQNKNGLNIVVYDKQRGFVVDSVCIKLGKNRIFTINRNSYESVEPKYRILQKRVLPYSTSWQNNCALEQSNKMISNIASVIRGYSIAEKLVADDMTIHYLVIGGDQTERAIQMLQTVILLKKYYSEEKTYYKEEQYGRLFHKAWVIKKVVVLTDKKLGDVAKVFSAVDNIVLLSRDELEDIELYAASFICVHRNLHGNGCGSSGEWIDDFAKRKLFGVPNYYWEMNLPINLPAEEEWILSSIHVQNESFCKAAEQMKDIDVPPEKRVILCPCTENNSMLSLTEWSAFISFCREHDFYVYTKIGSEREEPLPGTRRLAVPVDVLAAMGELGCIIVSIQNEITDVLRLINEDIKLLSVFCCGTPNDKIFTAERGLKEKVEYRGNTTYLLLNTGDNASKEMMIQLNYYIKGTSQRHYYSNLGKTSPLYSISFLNDYVYELVGMKHLMIFIVVCDSADKYWNRFDKEVLGLKSDLSQKRRRSYVAVVDRDQDFVYEELRQNYRETKYQSSFSDNIYYLSSHAMGKNHYTKCAIVINGQQYALNKRGLNIVVFSKEKNSVIDSIYVDMWADKTLRVRR